MCRIKDITVERKQKWYGHYIWLPLKEMLWEFVMLPAILGSYWGTKAWCSLHQSVNRFETRTKSWGSYMFSKSRGLPTSVCAKGKCRIFFATTWLSFLYATSLLSLWRNLRFIQHLTFFESGSLWLKIC